MVTKYSLDVLLSLFGTSLLFHVQLLLLLLDLHTDFSGDRSGGLVFPSLSEFSTISKLRITVCCDPHSQRLWHSQQSKSRCFSGTLLLFWWPRDVDNLISGSSAFSKSSLNIWKFTVHVLLKPGSENFEHYFAGVWDEWKCAMNILWHCLSLGLEWKLTFTSPVATAEFSKFAGLLSSQYHLLGFEIALL